MILSSQIHRRFKTKQQTQKHHHHHHHHSNTNSTLRNQRDQHEHNRDSLSHMIYLHTQCFIILIKTSRIFSLWAVMCFSLCALRIMGWQYPHTHTQERLTAVSHSFALWKKYMIMVQHIYFVNETWSDPNRDVWHHMQLLQTCLCCHGYLNVYIHWHTHVQHNEE